MHSPMVCVRTPGLLDQVTIDHDRFRSVGGCCRMPGPTRPNNRTVRESIVRTDVHGSGLALVS